MFKIEESPSAITFRSDRMATYRSAVVSECKNFLQKQGAPEGAATMVVFRELMNNAIKHGNKNAVENDLVCQITCRVTHLN